MRTALILSPYFPPSSLAGVHRARHLAKHLPAAGWHPVVICVDEAHHVEQPDYRLATLLPKNVEVVKTGALPARLTRAFGIAEISLRAWVPLWRALSRLLDAGQAKAVFITGSPYYPMLFGGEIKRRFGIPVVLDFQDPWVSAWGANQPRYSKAGIAHRIATVLEPRAVRHADFVTSVSDTQNAEMSRRYPWLDTSRVAAIPIGGDPDDFALLRDGPVSEAFGERLNAGQIDVSYVGTFLPRAEATMRLLLRSFARLRASEPRLADRIRLNFIGTSNQAQATANYRVRPIAQAEGVADAVWEIPQRLPYTEALAALARSHGLLLIGSDEPHYTASKIYPALMSGRPWLSIFHRSSSSHAVLSAAGGGIALAFGDAEELASLETPVLEALRTLACNPGSLGAADPAAYEPYTARAIAARFAAIFDRLAAERTH